MLTSKGAGADADFFVNGVEHSVDVPEEMPLLWVIRDVIGLTGAKYGCGIAQCGACTVHVDEQPVRSCVLPLANVAGKAATTIEAIGDETVGRTSMSARLAAQASE